MSKPPPKESWAFLLGSSLLVVVLTAPQRLRRRIADKLREGAARIDGRGNEPDEKLEEA